jgi:hypothetical protein
MEKSSTLRRLLEEHCLAAVQKDGLLLKDVPEALKTPEVCLAAVRRGYQGWQALEYVPESAKTPELCLYAVQRNGYALKFVPEALKTPELCLDAVQSNRYALKFVPEALKTPELCLAAVQQHGWALEHVPEALKTPELCLPAVGYGEGRAFKHIPELFLKNPDFCRVVVQQEGWDFTSKFVTWTSELCLVAVQQSCRALKYVPEKLKTWDLCLTVVKEYPNTLAYVPKKFITPEFYQAAVQQISVDIDGYAEIKQPSDLPREGRCSGCEKAQVECFKCRLDYAWASAEEEEEYYGVDTTDWALTDDEKEVFGRW